MLEAMEVVEKLEVPEIFVSGLCIGMFGFAILTVICCLGDVLFTCSSYLARRHKSKLLMRLLEEYVCKLNANGLVPDSEGNIRHFEHLICCELVELYDYELINEKLVKYSFWKRLFCLETRASRKYKYIKKKEKL